MKIFKYCDINNDGSVVITELRERLSGGWSKVVADQYATQLLATTDANRDGKISREEWMSFFDRVWTDDVASEHVDETMTYLLFGDSIKV